jgi:transposase
MTGIVARFLFPSLIRRRRRSRRIGRRLAQYSTAPLALSRMADLDAVRRLTGWELGVAVQEATGESVGLAYVDQGYSGERPAQEAKAHGMRLEVVKHEDTKRGFVLLPRRWVVERDFAWVSRFRRLVKDYERLPTTLAGLHFVAFACLFLRQAIAVLGASP